MSTSAQSAPLAELRYALQHLRRLGGEPTLRKLASMTPSGFSHTTVSDVLNGKRVPKWGVVREVVEALEGDVARFRDLWLAAENQRNPLELPPSRQNTPDEDGGNALKFPALTLSEVHAVKQDLEDRIEENHRHEQESREELLEKHEEQASIEDEIRQLSDQLATERKKRAKLEKRISELKTERDQLALRIDELRFELKESAATRLELSEESNELNERRAELYYEWARSEERRRQEAEARLRRHEKA